MMKIVIREQSNIFKPTLKFCEKTNVSIDNFRFVLSWHPVYVVKFDSTVAKTDTTQIIRKGHIHLQNNHIKCALYIVSHT